MKNKAFTLIELLVVIAIIGLISSIVLVGVRGSREKAQVAKAKTDIEGMIKAAQLYALNNGGKLPLNGQTTHCCDAFDSSWWSGCTNTPNTCDCLTANLINPTASYGTLPKKDPWGRCYLYHYHPNSTECNFIMSMGPNGVGDWWAEHNCTCDDDDICIFFGQGTQVY